VISDRFSLLFTLASALISFSCTDPLKEPPGGISGKVFLEPTPPPGEGWAFVRVFNSFADDTTRSDPSTNEFAFDNLKVVDLVTEYGLEAFREGYITYSDTVLIQAGATLVNYIITLHRGMKRDTVFQDGVSPDPGYAGCADTYISAPDSAAVHGFDDQLIIAGGHPDSLKRGLIYFAFTWQQYYPPMDTLSMEVEDAILSLYIDSVKTTASVDIVIFNLEHFFDEDAASWASNGDNPWPGGPGGSSGDLSSDTLTLSSPSSGWRDFSIEDIADEWLASSRPAAMMIRLVDESRQATVFFRSSDCDSTAYHPRLRLAINYLQ
jgi:hypothetical protein